MDTKYFTRITAQANIYQAVLKLNILIKRSEELLSGNRKKKFLSDNAFIENVIEPLSTEFLEHLCYLDEFIATKLNDKHDIELVSEFEENLISLTNIFKCFDFEEDDSYSGKLYFIKRIMEKAESANEKLN